MRFACSILFFLLTVGLSAQRELLNGQVIDAKKQPIPGVHVRNQTSQKVTVTTPDGQFSIPAQTGDTLLLTSVGFRALQVLVERHWFSGQATLVMIEGSIALNEVTVYSIPPIELFKEMIMETEVKDSVEFWYFGVDKPVFRGDKMAEGNIHKKALYAIIQPTSFLYYNLSKAEKEKRKHYQVQKNQTRTERLELKFTREWVAEHTGLKDEELTSFIAFCNYTPAYLDQASLYIIMEDMLAKLEEFQGKKEE